MKKCFIIVAAVLLLISSQGFANGKKDKKKLEIFSWWTTGDKARGLEAMYLVYSQRHPDVNIINAAANSDDEQNPEDVLAARMQGGNPPDSFQAHAGRELIDSWVVAGKMEPITFILAENNWLSSYPPEVIDMISYNGEVYSIPVNIHRSNVLWYNKAVFSVNNIIPPATMADFFAVTEQLVNAGVTPLALGDHDIRAATHLLENILLGTLGPAKYSGLWNGKTDWESANVKNALINFVKILNYVNTDHATLTWEQAAQYIIDGKCAMTIMADRAERFFTQKSLTPDKEFGWIPSPGTSKSFMMFFDSFGLPGEAPHKEQAIQWLTVCASKEGQDALNPFSGSIPGRIDCDRNLYDVYFQSAMEDFANTTIVPSAAHGAAAAEKWMIKIDDVMHIFVTDQDVEKAAAGFAAAAGSFIN